MFLLLIAIGARAQLAVQGPQPVYEGQTVTAIDLIANPHRDVSPFSALIEQKAGGPYSQSKIEASIAALKRTGQFPKVEVNVVPDPNGLRLNFLLEPAYYLGMVDFPGATKRFPYSRLLQSADLRDEDAYDAARVAVSARTLKNLFDQNGYFQATIQSGLEIDDEHRLVNVRFSVNLGKQAGIGGVSFQGTSDAGAARLQKSVRSLRARLTGGLLEPGKSYDSERITAALAVIKRTLAKQRRLAAQVRENPPQYHAETNRVDVSFKVELGPLVILRVTGARLSPVPFVSRREIKKLVPIYSEGTIDRDLVQEGEQSLTEYFQSKGYFDAQIKTTFEHQSDRILLVYEIDKGKKSKAVRVSFEGNRQIAEKDLRAAVLVKQAHIGSHGRVSQKLVEQSAKNVEALYRDRGYENAKVSSRIGVDKSRTDVVFEVAEGTQTLVESVAVTGNENVPFDRLASPIGFRLHSGAPFSARLLTEDRNRISANYLNRGYPNVEVRATVKRVAGGAHRVQVTYSIAEHQMVGIRDVIYLGQKRTRLPLIEKTANIQSGEPLKRGGLLQAESRLYDLNIFDWSSVGPTKPITDQTEETLLVKNHEGKRNEIVYGFGFEVSHRGSNAPTGTVAVPGGPVVQLGNNKIASSQLMFASPLGSIEFNRHNMRGLGETAGASLLLSRLDQRVLLTYAQPHFVGSQWASLSSFSVERTTENPLFGATLGDVSFQIERLLDRKTNTRFQIRYDFNKTALSHLLVPALVLPQDLNVHLSTLSGTLLRDTRDKPLDAHRGSFTSLDLGTTPLGLGSSANFAKFTGQFAYYKQLHSIVFANSVRLGLAKSFDGSFVPTSQLFFSGGGNSLRGFPIDEAGPQRVVPFCNVLAQTTGCVDITVPVGGRGLFVLNSEIRFPLPINKSLGGVIFYDGGNVYSAISLPNFVDNYSNTVGIGLRYATPIGPVRVDVGRNLNPAPGIGATQYYITLGQAF